MKQLFFIITAFMFFSCSSKQNKNTETNLLIKKYESIKIDTVSYKIKAIDSVKCGYYVNQFVYPRISGLKNIEFQKKVNKILTENINPFIESIESNIKLYDLAHSEYQPLEGGIEYDPEEIPSELYVSFDILNNDSIVSIIQHYSEGGGGGGNWRMENFKIINFNIESNILLSNSDLNTKLYNIAYLNNRIKLYFDICFPDEAKENYIHYPYIEKKNELNKLNYAIRNDSLMLVILATPTANYSYGTYIVPIDNWKRK